MNVNVQQDFATLVSEDIKNKLNQSGKDFLRLPENHQRWREALLSIIRSVTERVAEAEAQAQQLRATYQSYSVDPAQAIQEQLDRSLRFRFYAEKRLVEVDRLIQGAKETDPSLSLAAFLAEAIRQHRESKIADEQWDELDQSLWESLDGVWGF